MSSPGARAPQGGAPASNLLLLLPVLVPLAPRAQRRLCSLFTEIYPRPHQLLLSPFEVYAPSGSSQQPCSWVHHSWRKCWCRSGKS